jgi:dihydrodipicolinate synthase/N-acetylneuraminate lyase
MRIPVDVAQFHVPRHMTTDEIITVQAGRGDGDRRAPVGVDGARVATGRSRSSLAVLVTGCRGWIASVTNWAARFCVLNYFSRIWLIVNTGG